MHSAMGFDYAEPNWSKMLASAVIEVDGEPTMAGFVRKTSEVYMLTKGGRKRDELGNLIILHRELIGPTQRAGVEDWHCWLPPQIESNFGKVLMHLGWKRPLWPCFSRKVE